MTDPIADMFSQIKNAQALSRLGVKIPFSKMKYEICKILEKEGFVKKAEKSGKKEKKNIKITLKYNGENPAITDLKRISKSSRRVYTSSKSIRKVKGGYGIAIISTSKGLMTDSDSRKKNLGGEIICEVW